MDPNTRTHSPPLGDNDPPYQPEPPALSGTRSKTPAKSLAFSTASNASYVSLAIRQELSKRAPDGRRCLITRNVRPLEPCHLIPKAIPTEEQERLEYAWGMKAGELTINSTSNSTWLTRDMHGLFDGNCWALVPTKEVLSEMMCFNSFKSGSFLERFPEQIWEYHFVLFQYWPIVIMRFTDDKLMNFPEFSRETNFPASVQPEIDFPAFEVHKYPFEHLGVIKSHVHPFYVTYNAGQKVDAFLNLNKNYQPPSQAERYLPQLATCQSLYLSWINSIPPLYSIQQPPGTSHLPSSTRSWSNKPSEQQSDRGDQPAKRLCRFHGLDSSHSGAGTGAPEDCQDMTTSPTASQHLPTREQSMDSASDDHEHCLDSSGTNFPALHRTSVDDWVEGVKSAAPGEDPYAGGTEHAMQSLAEYKSERARVPPWGSWEQWIPNYQYVAVDPQDPQAMIPIPFLGNEELYSRAL